MTEVVVLRAEDWGSGIAPKLASRTQLGTFRPTTILLATSLALLLVGDAAHVALTGPAITIIAAAALLGFGLPHGALDIDMLRQHATHSRADLVGALLLYIGCAALTFVVWKAVPLVGLALFLGAAIKHFSDDWRVARSCFLAYALGTALIAAPVLTHGSEVRSIFTNLTGDPAVVVLADLLLLVAPVALLLGLIALAVTWRLGEHDQAVGGTLSLLALLVLPPVLGFAVFFCLFHSPLHFRREGGAAIIAGSRATTDWVMILTVAAIGIGMAIYALGTRGSMEARSVSASFMTLAVLTMPHLLVPRILAARASPAHALQQGRPDG